MALFVPKARPFSIFAFFARTVISKCANVMALQGPFGATPCEKLQQKVEAGEHAYAVANEQILNTLLAIGVSFL